ncbi:plasma-membrane proton-efflux P-type ATPase [Thermofilum pendens]|uniref:plasma-membrane proton-efflux P-type ATPase n=1 Tax=Thermofilum pendens TaxID=2269 RepID=UPI000A4135C0
MEEAFRILEASPSGLSEEEARRRLEKYGYNEVVEKKRSPVVEFLSRYWGPMPWLLELAIVLSYLLGHYLEAVIIFALLTVNAAIGFAHSRKSQKALEYLKKRLVVRVKVLRDGSWTTREAREIVPGDVVMLGLGDLVPADVKIVSGELLVDQSALTGESLPVSLKESDVAYAGSVVVRGEAKCLVVNTGVNTYFGRTAELVKIAKPRSHQEEIILAVTRYMLYVGVAALLATAAYALVRGMDLLSIAVFADIFLMGAVPVALPAVLTIVQAVGALELAKEGALVTRLSSVEDAASIDVVCLDKTGTITQNKLSVVGVVPLRGYGEDDVALVAALASSEEGKDIIDSAVIGYARSRGLRLEAYRRVSFTPFDPSLKRSEAVVEHDGARFKAVKGAPQVVLELCNGAPREAEEALEELSRRGYRVLAVARSPDNDLDTLTPVGLLALADPVRPDSKALIEELKSLGIKPMMLTGDNVAIAREVARQASIGDRVVSFAEFKRLSRDEKLRLVDTYDGFAEVYPEDKYEIVRLLQEKGHMVGMTGDGVNDAPALKQAEMGIAVSNATDVAKASASVVLTEEGLKGIVKAIVVSRQVYQRLLSWVVNKVVKVVQFIGMLALGFFWLNRLLLGLLDMTLLLLANDFSTMSLATDNVKHTSNPNKWNVRNITLASLAVGILMVAEGMLAIALGMRYLGLEEKQLRSFTLLLLVYSSQFRVYIVRERKHFWSSRPGNALLASITATIAVFTAMAVLGVLMTPLTPLQALFALGYTAAFTLGVVDPVKYVAFKKFQL